MLKKIISVIMLSAAVSVQTVYADDIRVFMNNKEVIFDTAPEILNNRTMVPMRAIFEAMGMIVQWQPETGEAVAFNEKGSLSFAAGVPYMNVNGKIKDVDTAPVILNSRMLVPVRAVAEASGCGVDWDEENRHVLITTSSFNNTSEWNREILRLTNEVREKNGLKALKWNDALAETAYKHSLDMVNRGFFDHVNPDGDDPADRFVSAGIGFYAAAENIAAGQASPEAAMEAWMNSEGHRENILNPDLEELGVGIAYGGEYGIYWTQNFAAFR